MRVIHLNIRTKLILYFLIAILLPTSLISLILYFRSTEIITEKINMSIVKDLRSVESIMLHKLDSINDYSVLITLNTELQSIISSKQPQEDEEIIDEVLKLDSILDSYYISDFSAITKTPLYPKIYVMDRPKYRNVHLSDKVFDISEIENEAWYADLPNKLTVIGMNRVTVSGRQAETLRISRKLVALRGADMAPEAALLTTDIDADYFIQLLDTYKATSGSLIQLLDGKDQPVLSSRGVANWEQWSGRDKLDMEELKRVGTLELQELGGVKMLVSAVPIESIGWTVVSFTPLSEINVEQRNLNSVVLVIMLISMVFALMVARILAGNISKPILALVKSMSFVDHDNLNIKMSYHKKDEFGILFNQYKRMMEKIKDLVERLYVSEVREKEAALKAKDAELKALQAQINPHFLYNTLDSINLYAMRHHVPNISLMVNSLSNFFRYGLSKGKSVITLQDERKHVESYLEIQKMRFGDRLHYDFDFPHEVKKCLIVKLALQPLVENAIIHGIQQGERPGHVHISAVINNDRLQIRIADNGAGGNIEQMEEMLNVESTMNHSFGTRNVNQRIKYVFGKQYGLTFSHNESGGITVIVELPMLRTMEGYHADNDIS